MNVFTRFACVLLFGFAVQCPAAERAVSADSSFVGHWALTIPGGGAGWLGVEQDGDQLVGSMLWGGGSVVPVPSLREEGDALVVTRVRRQRRRGTTQAIQQIETITATRDGDQMKLVLRRTDVDGNVRGEVEFSGQRIPPLPPAPELAKIQFGDPIQLFSGKDLSGWSVMNSSVPNGWSAQNGVLVNEAKQPPDGHISYANLRTDAEFEDFNLTLDVRVPERGNSGVYLRGIYEVQVADTYGRAVDSHNMGAIYSRITPTVAAEKPAGQWQSLDITLVDRHVTVILNGQKIVDNQPLLGCTGGALWADQFRPGPIYLQGDHTSVEYRNIVLRPVIQSEQ